MKPVLPILSVLAALALGFALGRCGAGEPHATHPSSESGAAAGEDALWTCPMHPQIVLPDPVPCPICGMDLVPFDPAQGPGPMRIALTPEAAALAGVRTQLVERRPLELPVRLVGTVEVAEDAVRTIAATIPGRIERLFVNTTGMQVSAGDHLFEIFSPELLTAQEELLGARRQLDELAPDASEFLTQSARRALEAAREKLVLWQLTPERIAEIERGGEALRSVQIDAPFSGTVIRRDVEQGAYVVQGEPVFEVADLSRLWLELEAYEQDLPFLRYGQRVDVGAEALPGQRFAGTISFVEPMIDRATRTASIRVHVENPRGELKPGMFVRAEAFARLDADGTVRGGELTGKWISPMHPEIVADGPGQCTVCGMDLVPAEQLGLVSQGPFADPVVVPRGAVMWTGARSLVYVEVEAGVYEAREVELGPRAGEHHVVLEGLELGERVVARGAFRIDSEMQIRAKPSMLSQPGEERSEPASVPFSDAHDALWRDYLAVSRALAGDELEAAGDALGRLQESARIALEAEAGPDDVRAALRRVADAAEAVDAEVDVETLRAAFEPITEAGRALLDVAGNRSSESLRTAYCPMAADGVGAHWLQGEEELANPYFGATMLRCGNFEADHPAAEAP